MTSSSGSASDGLLSPDEALPGDAGPAAPAAAGRAAHRPRAGAVPVDAADAARRLEIVDALDEAIERCRRRRLPLLDALASLFPLACTMLEAHSAFVRAIDERLERVTYTSGPFASAWQDAVPVAFPTEEEVEARPDWWEDRDDASLALRVLDCAGEVLGVAAFAFPPGLTGSQRARQRGEVRAACETIDNFLEGIAAGARKHRLSVSVSQSLRTSILEDGADRAIKMLSERLELTGALLYYAESGAGERATVRYRLYRGGGPVADSVDRPDEQLEAIFAGPMSPPHIDEATLAELLGGPGVVQSQLINGLSQAPIGRLIVATRRQGGLDPEGTDVVHLFAESLSQRLVDYNRERRVLSAAFAPSVVTQLLREPNKFQRFLSPRVSEIAILFVDIVGFTALCERVLADASKIAQLINRWAEGAIDAVFRHDGVFDKLIGDCVIGLFGPPFYRSSIDDYALSAVRCAREIAEYTAMLGEALRLDERLQQAGIGTGLGVSAGVNVGTTSVGFFGPNSDFTGFSSAMNQAARLQGLAGFQEVLVSGAVATLVEPRVAAEGLRLVGPETARVKNVAEPLVYYRVRAIDEADAVPRTSGRLRMPKERGGP